MQEKRTLKQKKKITIINNKKKIFEYKGNFRHD